MPSPDATLARKPQELRQALIAFGGAEVGAGVLIDTLWPDSEGDAAYHALESALYKRRQLLGARLVGTSQTNAACNIPPDRPCADSFAQGAQPNATLNLKGGSVAVGIGYAWGHGELVYHDSSQRFSIKDVSVVDVGANDFSASGCVFNLNKLEDCSGKYVGAGAGTYRPTVCT
jgi:hypothetical protein